MPIKKDLTSKQEGGVNESQRGLTPLKGVKPLVEENGSLTKQSKKSVKFFDLIISICLVALFFGLPLFFTNLTLQGLAFEKQMYFYFWLFIGLVSWVIKGMLEGEMKIKRTPLDIFLILFWLVYLAATIFSVDRWHSLWGFFGDPSKGLISITLLILVYYFIINNFNEKRFRWILGSLILSGIIISLWTALVVFGYKFIPNKILSIMPLSLVGSLGGLTIFLAFNIPLLITAVYQLKQNENLEKISKRLMIVIFLLFIILNLFLLFALYGYVSWYAVLIGVGFYLIYILAQVVRPQSWLWLPIVVFIALFTIFMIGNYQIIKINLPVEVSPNYEFSWQIAREALKDKWLLGSGPATYGYDFSLYRSEDFNLNTLYNIRFYQGKGIIFELLPTIGVIGTVIFVLIVLTYLSISIYSLSKEKEKNKIYSLGFLSASLIFLICILIERIEGPIILFSVLAGSLVLGILRLEGEEEERAINLSLKASPRLALPLAFIFLVVSMGIIYIFVVVGKIYLADIKAGRASSYLSTSPQEAINKMGQALNLNNKEGRYYSSLAQIYSYFLNIETAKADKERNVNLLRDYLNGSWVAAERARALMPNDVLVNEILAQIYENTSFYVNDPQNTLKSAEEQYKKSLGLEPQNPNFDLRLGMVKTTQASLEQKEEAKKKLIEEAKVYFEKAISKKNNFAPAYFQLALTEEALGSLDEAINKMNNAVGLAPDNMTYAFNLGRMYQARGKDNDNQAAENIFKAILGVNNKEINTHFNLALLYEKTQRKDEAIKEYQEALSLLPEESAEAKGKIEEMIKKVESGGSNLSEIVNTQNTTSSAEASPETSQ